MILGSMDDADYVKLPGERQSQLAQMKKSPGHYKYIPFKETPAMKMGNFLHTGLSNPTEFKDSFVIEPEQIIIKGVLVDVNKKSKTHRKALLDWRDLQKGKTIMTPKEAENITGMLEEVARDPFIVDLIENGQPEVAATWDYRGRKCKGKADVWYPNHKEYGNLVVDFKKTQKAGESDFSRSVINYAYDLQGAFYTEGFRADNFLFIAIEENGLETYDGIKRHPIGKWNAKIWMESGTNLMNRLLKRVEECEQSGIWPWYSDGVQDLRPPGWYANLNFEEET